MDRRLLEYYLARRWFRWPVMFTLAVASGLALDFMRHARGVEWFFAGLALIFVNSAKVGRNTSRSLRALPISGPTMAKTVWAAFVGLPLVLVCFGLFLGMALLVLSRPASSPVLWPAATMLAYYAVFFSAFFAANMEASTRHGRTWGRAFGIAALLAFALPPVAMYLGSTALFVQMTIVVAALPLTILSYLFVATGAGAISVLKESLEERQGGHADSCGTISWHSAAMASPFSAVPLGAFGKLLFLLPIVLVWATAGAVLGPHGIPREKIPAVAHRIGELLPRVLCGHQYLIAIVPILILYVSSRWISSMRAVAPLPVSRRNLTLAVLLLPLVGSLPFLPFSGPLAALFGFWAPFRPGRFLANYSLAMGVVMVAQALNLAWKGDNEKPARRTNSWAEPLGRTVAILGAALVIWLIWELVSHNVDTVLACWYAIVKYWTWIALVTGSALIVLSTRWSYRLLAYGSAPYLPQKGSDLVNWPDDSE